MADEPWVQSAKIDTLNNERHERVAMGKGGRHFRFILAFSPFSYLVTFHNICIGFVAAGRAACIYGHPLVSVGIMDCS